MGENLVIIMAGKDMIRSVEKMNMSYRQGGHMLCAGLKNWIGNADPDRKSGLSWRKNERPAKNRDTQ